MKINISILSAAISLLLFSSCGTQNKGVVKKSTRSEVILKSPNNHYAYNFKINEEANTATYTIKYKGKDIIAPSGLGFEIEGVSIGGKVKIEATEKTSVSTTWKPVYGEKNEYPDIYEETLISLSGNNAMFNLRVRVYNEGVAFRYEFSKNQSKIQINKELTEFSLAHDAQVWKASRAQKPIVKTPISKIRGAVERPLLVELSDSLFVAIGEAALVDYARMKLTNNPEKSGTLVSELSSDVIKDKPFNTPWRFIMASEKPGEILENNFLVLNLNEENKLKDTSWIRPGKIIRESTLTTKGGMACVDFAVKHNLQFIEFDAGWYGKENDEASDATTITIDSERSNGPLDLLGVIEYAKSNNIGVVLYVNRRALEKQLDDILPLLSSWGVSGLKYGFVNVGSQEWTSWLHDAVRKAADYKMMVDIHDEYRPTGYSRTYPNLMTQEGIRGDEEAPKNSMVLNTLFTRMIAGAGDQTNCYFATRVEERMSSHASQLAKAVCIYSPWQFLYWYDRPEGSDADGPGAGDTKSFIQEVPELAFYDALPTVWDDTKIIDGYPGEFGIVARRNGNDWFLGALTGDKGRKLDIALGFLDQGKTYEATIYSDDENSQTITKVKIDKKSVKSSDTINYEVLKQNGLAIHFRAL